MKPLRVFAVLFGLLAVSNLIKPIEADGQGFVFFGRRLAGAPNVIAAWSFAGFLAAYAGALWREKAAALPMGIAYGAYVAANTAFFQVRTAGMENNPLFGVAYVAIALGVTWGAVALMLRDGYERKDAARGRVVLRSFALLFALMALSNLLKVFEYSDTTGFVLFGQRLSGAANVTATLGFSAFLAFYASCVWRERSPAVALGTIYALYVVVNLVLWNVRKPEGAELPLLFSIGYLVSAVGVSGGAALLLRRYADRYI